MFGYPAVIDEFILFRFCSVSAEHSGTWRNMVMALAAGAVLIRGLCGYRPAEACSVLLLLPSAHQAACVPFRRPLSLPVCLLYGCSMRPAGKRNKRNKRNIFSYAAGIDEFILFRFCSVSAEQEFVCKRRAALFSGKVQFFEPYVFNCFLRIFLKYLDFSC
jgi:hypothetical protein